MIRKFKFEAEIYESLNCLPMAARRKLDAVGIKLHLAQWEQLGRGERLMICHAPADSEEEQSALRTFIEEVSAGTYWLSGQDPSRRCAPVRQSARSSAAAAGSARARVRHRTRRHGMGGTRRRPALRPD